MEKRAGLCVGLLLLSESRYSACGASLWELIISLEACAGLQFSDLDK